jgi:uncharacterized protein (TIGR04255 family)
VPLPDAPLVRVIAQVRFAEILALQTRDAVAPFQEAIRGEYPILRPQHTQSIAVLPEGAAAGPKQTTWRFCGPENTWRASLSTDFLALETTRYTSRRDFLARLERLIDALAHHVKPAIVQRFGVRYIDRIEGDAIASIGRLVRHEMVGVLDAGLSDYVERATGDVWYAFPNSEDRMRVRWGLIPPNSTVDPGAIEPIDSLSWILDLDMFSAAESTFSSEAILATARRYTERVYAMFRWIVTDEFLRLYGGTP